MEHKTTIDSNIYVREEYANALCPWQKGKIGGPNKNVEIYKNLFTRKKNNVGCILPFQWILDNLY